MGEKVWTYGANHARKVMLYGQWSWFVGRPLQLGLYSAKYLIFKVLNLRSRSERSWFVGESVGVYGAHPVKGHGLWVESAIDVCAHLL